MENRVNDDFDSSSSDKSDSGPGGQPDSEPYNGPKILLRNLMMSLKILLRNLMIKNIF